MIFIELQREIFEGGTWYIYQFPVHKGVGMSFNILIDSKAMEMIVTILLSCRKAWHTDIEDTPGFHRDRKGGEWHEATQKTKNAWVPDQSIPRISLEYSDWMNQWLQGMMYHQTPSLQRMTPMYTTQGNKTEAN